MNTIRTRFAPSPTGIMHIGNVRAALLNYLFALKNNGTFILRIEDTDAQRNIAHGTQSILKHLHWLSLPFTEGPEKPGAFGPYFQSQRSDIYQKHLDVLIDKKLAYRCFCTPEELETRRNKQIALKKPPRYESTCLRLSEQTIQSLLAGNKPFIWRMKTDSTQKVSFTDMARGILEFDLQNFYDFPLSREDGSFTFIFANCVDDITMEISHVFRGEEHLSNTVSQVVLYQALNSKIPTFWHLPILCNLDGKKLSKRDRGFSLDDLQEQGFLPEAICNYLAILGTSFEQEIMSLNEIAQNYKFDHLHGISQIRYDVAKLLWINHKWIAKLTPQELTTLCKPFLQESFDLSTISNDTLQTLLIKIQNDMHTLCDSKTLLGFYFKKPLMNREEIAQIMNLEDFDALHKLIKSIQPEDDWQPFLTKLKLQAKAANFADKNLYATLRILLTGQSKGMQLNDIFVCLGKKEFFDRLHQ